MRIAWKRRGKGEKNIYPWVEIVSRVSTSHKTVKACTRRFERVWGLLQYENLFWDVTGPIKIIQKNGRAYSIK